MYKMYCVTSREVLKLASGNRGKMMSQSGHAFLHCWFKAMWRFPIAAWRYKWSGRATKVTLVVDTIAEVEALYEAYKGRVGTSLVRDAAKTVFDKPTVTCLGIGPIKPSQMNSDLTSLRPLI